MILLKIFVSAPHFLYPGCQRIFFSKAKENAAIERNRRQSGVLLDLGKKVFLVPRV